MRALNVAPLVPPALLDFLTVRLHLCTLGYLPYHHAVSRKLCRALSQGTQCLVITVGPSQGLPPQLFIVRMVLVSPQLTRTNFHLIPQMIYHVHSTCASLWCLIQLYPFKYKHVWTARAGPRALCRSQSCVQDGSPQPGLPGALLDPLTELLDHMWNSQSTGSHSAALWPLTISHDAWM